MLITKSKPKYDKMKVSNIMYMNLEDDGFKYDMIDGVLYMAPSPFFPHGDSSGSLFWKMKKFIHANKLGKVVQEIDVHLPDGGDVLRPDISIVLNENKKIIQKWIMGTPDLVCEVLSDSTREHDLGRKANRYLSNGVKEYWIVDIDEKWVELWKNKNTYWEKIRSANLESDVLKGFILDTKDFFQEVSE